MTNEELLVQFLSNNRLYMFKDEYNIEQEIKDVIYEGERTVVLWIDGSKTIVRPCGGDNFNPEFGLAMAISQKLFGSRNKFVKYVEEKVAKAAKRKPSKKQMKQLLSIEI